MKEYLLSLLGASFAVALVGILSPNGSVKHMRLISSLFLICVLAAPLPKAIGSLHSFTEELNGAPGESGNNDYTEQMEEAVNSASRAYFAQTLTQMLEQRFSIKTGEVRCLIQWAQDGEQLRPLKITVILSGSAIWKNPADLEEFVQNLLGCECVTAIE